MVEGVPKYIAVRDNLRARIDSMEANEQLPPEIELCKQYNVSRITLSKMQSITLLLKDYLFVSRVEEHFELLQLFLVIVKK